MKTSIALASYNGAKYLRAQLDSFVNQTCQPDELIITDDCSTDETESIVREFAKTAPFRVEFYRNEKNLGYCGNFNAALIKTTGDLVFLSDQDDVWFPEKIEYMISVAEAKPSALVLMNNALFTDGQLNEVGLTKIGQILDAGLPLENFVMGCCATVRRELLDFALPIPPGLKSHDNWLVGIADTLNAKVVEDKVLQFYRRHEVNESQDIVNRTTKVSRSRVMLHLLSTVIRNDGFSRLNERIDQRKRFVDGLSQLMPKVPNRYQQAMSDLQRNAEASLLVMQQRVAIRERSFFPRLIAAIGCFGRGGYRDGGGWKALLRDIVG